MGFGGKLSGFFWSSPYIDRLSIGSNMAGYIPGRYIFEYWWFALVGGGMRRWDSHRHGSHDLHGGAGIAEYLPGGWRLLAGRGDLVEYSHGERVRRYRVDANRLYL